ncbi:MAG: DUF1801 domain-containing protein [Proteobacteria bacterium]|nr:DUF1801 domain-containing protein [Pseudomonadota bacterium]
MKVDNSVKSFVDDTFSVDEEKGKLLLSLQKIVLKICPAAEEGVKYGGLIFNKNAELICGIFVYKKHISLEFSFGIEFSDPRGFLEGSGKYRRHLKIVNRKDIDKKDVTFFVSQAFRR